MKPFSIVLVVSALSSCGHMDLPSQVQREPAKPTPADPALARWELPYLNAFEACSGKLEIHNDNIIQIGPKLSPFNRLTHGAPLPRLDSKAI